MRVIQLRDGAIKREMLRIIIDRLVCQINFEIVSFEPDSVGYSCLCVIGGHESVLMMDLRPYRIANKSL